MSDAVVASRGGRRGRARATHSAFYRSTQEQSRALYHCNYCHKDISDNVRIKCADCADFDLCVECFSVGVETNGHSNSHSYRVMDNLSFPIYHPSWGSDEELLLLEAVDIYGPGNWAAVAEHVGTKSTAACKQHYFQIYIEPDSCPLPTPAPEMAGLDVKQLAALAKSSCGRKRARLHPEELKQQQQQQQQAAAQPGTTPQQPKAEQASSKKQQQQHEVKQEPAAAGQAKDEAAAAAAGGGSGMEVDGDVKQEQQHVAAAGTPHGKGSKRSRPAGTPDKPAAAAAAAEQPHPQQAGKHLPEPGQQAKPPAADGGGGAGAAPAGGLTLGGGAALLGSGLGLAGGAAAAAGAGAAGGGAAAGGAAGAGAEPPRVKGSGPQLDMLTGWHAKRFEFEPEWDNEAESAIADLEFREDDSPSEVAGKLRMLEIYNKRLDERARRQALILEHGLLNVRRMQGLERRRMAGEREQYAQMRVFARFQPPGAHEGLVEGLLLEGRLRLRIAELQAHRAAGRRTMAEIEEAEIVEAAAKKRAAAKSGATGDEAGAAGGNSSVNLGGYRNLASALNVWRQRRGLALDITGLPGVEQLSAREAELCSAARLLPAHYLSLKDMMMRDAQVHGHISRHDARNFFRLDAARSARVWELLCSTGWLKDTSPEEAEDKRRLARQAASAAAAGGAAAAAPAPAPAAAAAAQAPPAAAVKKDAGGAAAAAAGAGSNASQQAAAPAPAPRQRQRRQSASVAAGDGEGGGDAAAKDG